jgi:hypothetical protein
VARSHRSYSARVFSRTRHRIREVVEVFLLFDLPDHEEASGGLADIDKSVSSA